MAATAEAYTPTESVEENMEQLQSRQTAAWASALNKTAQAGQKMFKVYEGAKSGASKTKDIASDGLSLPGGVKAIAALRDDNNAKHKKTKVLSFDFLADKLTPQAVIAAHEYGFISDDNPVYDELHGTSESYNQSAKTPSIAMTAASPVIEPTGYVPPKKSKSLPETFTSHIGDYMQTESDFREAQANVGDYLVTSEEDLIDSHKDESLDASVQAGKSILDSITNPTPDIANAMQNVKNAIDRTNIDLISELGIDMAQQKYC